MEDKKKCYTHTHSHVSIHSMEGNCPEKLQTYKWERLYIYIYTHKTSIFCLNKGLELI